MSVVDFSVFNDILQRFEAVAERLEQAAHTQGSGAVSASNGAAPARAPGASSASSAPAAVDCEIALSFDSFVAAKLPAIQAAAKASGIKDLEEATETLVATFRMLRDGLAATAVAAKPKDEDWGKIFPPVMELGSKANKACDNRSNYFQSRKIAAESVNVVALLTQAGPVGHVKSVIETVDFHCVKALQKKEEKESVWVKSVKEILKGLADWCTENCKMGLTWKFQGQDALAYFAAHPLGAGGAAQAPAAPAAAPAAVPAKGKGKGPPPPKGGFAKPPEELKAGGAKAAPAAGGGMAELFGALQGFNTGNLKKVTDDMKSKNRPKEEGSSIVPASTAAKPRGSTTSAITVRGQKGPKGEPLLELQKDTNWMVENFDGKKDIVLEEADMKQLVCIINCRDCVVHIKNKVKNVNIDGCIKTTVICGDVVSAVEFVNSDRMQFQTTGKVNAIAIDKCDGVNLYVSKESMDVEISTSKSSDMNVNVPDVDGGDDADMIEMPIPEQFVTKISGKKLKTEVSALYSH